MSIRQCVVQNFTFSGPSLLNHNMNAASVTEDGAFGFTNEIFNMKEEQ